MSADFSGGYRRRQLYHVADKPPLPADFCRQALPPLPCQNTKSDRPCAGGGRRQCPADNDCSAGGPEKPPAKALH